MKQKKLSMLNKIILIFLVLQPLFDIYMAVVGESLDIFGISIVTLIRATLVVALFGIVIIYQIKNKVHIKLLYLILGYLAFVLIYALAHHLNIVYSNGYYITQGIYNVVTEIMYVERLVVPVLLVYIVIITKPDKIRLEQVLVTVATVISLVIIVSNLFKVSFASYSQTEGNTMISYSVIDWFTENNVPYRESLSKGFFVSANQIGALLVVLLPIVIHYMLKENKPHLYFVFFIQIVAMTLIGTRVASLGWMLVCLAMAIIYLILMFVKKVEKPSLQSLCTIIVILEAAFLLYLNSPAQNRDFAESYDGMYEQEIEEKEETGEYIALEAFSNILQDEQQLIEYVGEAISDKGLKYDAMCKYISETHKYHYITDKYINNIYPYTDDPTFWLEIFASPISVKADNRGRQIEIVKRIKENNHNILFDTLFGMGATPMNSRDYMIENDLISHFYNLGIIGTIIFVIPFVACIIYVAIKMRKNILKLFNLQFLAYVLAVCMAYFVGYFAGHVLDEYIVTIFLAAIAGTIFNLYSEGDLNEKAKT
ncbi:MAG: O-antigen ligase family protein [Clostridia bacterium]|nr:O-antigen ligase family protein [Clostridia bacterium]